MAGPLLSVVLATPDSLRNHPRHHAPPAGSNRARLHRTRHHRALRSKPSNRPPKTSRDSTRINSSLSAPSPPSDAPTPPEFDAHAPIVALAEDHCFPEPGWADALIRAHQGPWAVVGPVVRNANPATIVSWCDFVIGYGPWMERSRKRSRTRPAQSCPSCPATTAATSVPCCSNMATSWKISWTPKPCCTWTSPAAAINSAWSPKRAPHTPTSRCCPLGCPFSFTADASSVDRAPLAGPSQNGCSTSPRRR